MNKVVHERYHNAIALEKKGRLKEAEKEYRLILNEKGIARDVRMSLGALYAKMDRLDEALSMFQEAMDSKLDYLVQFNIGSLLYKKGKYKKAIILLEKSKEMNPHFSLTKLVMGLCFSRLDNLKAAELNFLDVLKTWPGNRVALTAMSILYYNTGRFDKALLLVQKLIEQDPDNRAVQDLKVQTLYKAGRFGEAADDLKERKTRLDGYTLYDRFIASVPVDVYTDKYGTLDEKIDKLNEKDDVKSKVTLSLCHMLKGDTDRAIDYLFEARQTGA